MMCKPKLRFLIAPARSGTTAFLHTMSQSSNIGTASGSIKRFLRDGGNEDYSIYEIKSRFEYLFYRALFGRGSIAECTYSVFRSDEDISLTRPLFLFRDPVQTFNSWKKVGNSYDIIDNFIVAYQHTLNQYYRVREVGEGRCITYEGISKNSEQAFRKIFSYWDIPYDEQILNWHTELGEKTIKAEEHDDQQKKLRTHISMGLHKSLIDGTQAFRSVQNQLFLESYEISQLEYKFRVPYEEIALVSQQYLLLE
jgi:hypothetical protein